MPKLLTQSAYAEQRGCSQQYISKLVLKGIITLTEGKIDQEQADRAIQTHADPLHAKNRQKNTEVNAIFKQAQLKKLTFDMQLNKLKCEIIDGQWVSKRAVEQRAFEEGRIIRDAIMRLADRYEVAFANPKSREITRQRIREEMRDIILQAKDRYMKFLNREAKALAKKEMLEDE